MSTINLDPTSQVPIRPTAPQAKRGCCCSILTQIFRPIRFIASSLWGLCSKPTVIPAETSKSMVAGVKDRSLIQEFVQELGEDEIDDQSLLQHAIEAEKIPVVLAILRDPAFEISPEEASQALEKLIPLDEFGADYELGELIARRVKETRALRTENPAGAHRITRDFLRSLNVSPTIALGINDTIQGKSVFQHSVDKRNIYVMIALLSDSNFQITPEEATAYFRVLFPKAPEGEEVVLAEALLSRGANGSTPSLQDSVDASSSPHVMDFIYKLQASCRVTQEDVLGGKSLFQLACEQENFPVMHALLKSKGYPQEFPFCSRMDLAAAKDTLVKARITPDAPIDKRAYAQFLLPLQKEYCLDLNQAVAGRVSRTKLATVPVIVHAFHKRNRAVLLTLLQDESIAVPEKLANISSKQRAEKELVQLLIGRGAVCTSSGSFDQVVKHYVHALKNGDQAFIRSMRRLEKDIWESPSFEIYFFQAIKEQNEAFLEAYARVKPNRRWLQEPLAAALVWDKPRSAAILLKCGERIEEMALLSATERLDLDEELFVADDLEFYLQLAEELQNGKLSDDGLSFNEAFLLGIRAKKAKSVVERIFYNKIIAFLSKNIRVSPEELKAFILTSAIILQQEKGMGLTKEELECPASKIVRNARKFFKEAITKHDKVLVDAYAEMYLPKVDEEHSPLDIAFQERNYYALAKLADLNLYFVPPKYLTAEVLIEAARNGFMNTLKLCLDRVSIHEKVGGRSVLSLLMQEKRDAALAHVLAHPQIKMWSQSEAPLDWLKREYGYSNSKLTTEYLFHPSVWIDPATLKE